MEKVNMNKYEIARRKCNYTIQQLCNELGCSKSYWSYIENNKKEPNINIIEDFCKIRQEKVKPKTLNKWFYLPNGHIQESNNKTNEKHICTEKELKLAFAQYETIEDLILTKYGIYLETLQFLEKIVNGEYHKNGLLKEHFTLEKINALIVSEHSLPILNKLDECLDGFDKHQITSETLKKRDKSIYELSQVITNAVENFVDDYIIDNISIDGKTKEELRLLLKQKR